VLRRFSPRALLDMGLVGVTLGAVGTLMLVVTQQHLDLYAVVAVVFLMVFGTGLVRPNATALALDRHPDTAGSAAAILGMTQFTLGAIAAPLTELDAHSAVPLGVTVVTAALLAAFARLMARGKT